jgi:hypothetical protein
MVRPYLETLTSGRYRDIREAAGCDPSESGPAVTYF